MNSADIFELLNTPLAAYTHALKQGKRFYLCEPTIMRDPMCAYLYAKEVVKERWLKAEPIILKHPECANQYLRTFPEARTPSKDVPLTFGLTTGDKWIIKDVPNTITDDQLSTLLSHIFPNLTQPVINCLIGERIYFEPTIKKFLTDPNYMSNVTNIIDTHSLLDYDIRVNFLNSLFMCDIASDFDN